GTRSFLIENQFFGHTPPHEERDIVLSLHSIEIHAIFVRKSLSHAQSHPAWDDRHFMDRICARHELTNERVTCFVISGRTLFAVADDHAFALDTHQDFVLSVFKINKLEVLLVRTSREKGSLVHQVLEIST